MKFENRILKISMRSFQFYFLFIFSLFLFNCSSDDSDNTIDDRDSTNNPEDSAANQFKYLALGDSYTIGQGVCSSCRFPEQLKDSIMIRVDDSSVDLDIIAQTGWTTTNLNEMINSQNPSSDYDLVTLLIGVNNQFQGRPFSLYEQEFDILLERAIGFAAGDHTKVIVVSIPDYAFTPFGQTSSNPGRISNEIDAYNSYALSAANARNVSFVNITDITRDGLENPNLVASDGLHPSERAYTKFVERILPLALDKIVD